MGNFKDNFKSDFIKSIREDEEELITQDIAKKEGLDYMAPQGVKVNPNALKILSEKKSRDSKIAIYEFKRKNLFAVTKTLQNKKLDEVLEELKDKGYTITLSLASQKTLEYMWRIYKDISLSKRSGVGSVDISGARINSFINSVTNLSSLRGAINIIEEGEVKSATDILEIILAGAISLKSSDIHIEPDEENLNLRYRLDGILVNVTTVLSDQKKYLIPRIKLISGLKLNVVDRAQDGRFSINLNNKSIEIRVSSIPGPKSESIVMRLLDPEGLVYDLESLGLDEKTLSIVEEQIKRPNGIIINAGPTGSGKTTSLYSFLKKIVTPNIKVITLEDPIEYELAGVVQTQVDHNRYTFSSGLRSILRQDPDVIMIGEIRDKEVAETALNAALSGHIVFSTLHTNNAPGGFTRLIDLGIDQKVISSAINLIIAQRLVRKIIPEKAIKKPASNKEIETIKKLIDDMPQEYKEKIKGKDITSFLEPNEELIDNTSEAYKGRVGIFELLVMDKNIEEVILKNPSIRDIYEASRQQGLLTLNQDAIIKAINGVTSLSEVKRVVDIFALDR